MMLIIVHQVVEVLGFSNDERIIVKSSKINVQKLSQSDRVQSANCQLPDSCMNWGLPLQSAYVNVPPGFGTDTSRRLTLSTWRDIPRPERPSVSLCLPGWSGVECNICTGDSACSLKIIGDWKITFSPTRFLLCSANARSQIMSSQPTFTRFLDKSDSGYA
jgi:hypothetical protein